MVQCAISTAVLFLIRVLTIVAFILYYREIGYFAHM